jgi:hypothetical protein
MFEERGYRKSGEISIVVSSFRLRFILPTFHLIIPFPLNPKVISLSPQREFLRWQSPAAAIKDTRQRRTVIDSRAFRPRLPMCRCANRAADNTGFRIRRGSVRQRPRGRRVSSAVGESRDCGDNSRASILSGRMRNTAEMPAGASSFGRW